MRMRLRSAILPLIGINVVMFIIQIITESAGIPFTETLLVHKGDAFLQPWTLLTSTFLHSGFGHLFFNMYALLLFGPLLEARIGMKRFLTIYLASGIIASLASSFIYNAALGASGAVMGIIGVLIILMPNLQLLLFFFIPMPLWLAGVVWALLDFFQIFPGVAHAAHLAGMASGVAYGLFMRKKKKKHEQRFSSKNHLDQEDIEEYLKSGRI